MAFLTFTILSHHHLCLQNGLITRHHTAPPSHRTGSASRFPPPHTPSPAACALLTPRIHFRRRLVSVDPICAPACPTSFAWRDVARVRPRYRGPSASLLAVAEGHAPARVRTAVRLSVGLGRTGVWFHCSVIANDNGIAANTEFALSISVAVKQTQRNIHRVHRFSAPSSAHEVHSETCEHHPPPPSPEPASPPPAPGNPPAPFYPCKLDESG